jgi:DNA-binding NtrC family response regulator
MDTHRMSIDLDGCATEKYPEPSAAPRRPKLQGFVVLHTPAEALNLAPVPVRGSTLSLGRDTQTVSGQAFVDPRMSRGKVQVEVMAEGAVRIQDLGSTNGIFVEGNKVTSAPLHEGTLVRHGDTLLLWTNRLDEYVRAEPRDELTRIVVGASPETKALRAQVRASAAEAIPVHIAGPTGSGKSLIAFALSRIGKREPFLALNCGSVQQSLASSELFGHERGAFTGADRRKSGAFERVGKGTLFLDEVAELPLETQASLLRALQERRFTRLGGDVELIFSGRIISATNESLIARVKAGEFKEALFSRLCGVLLVVAPLDQRRADVPALVHHFLASHRFAPVTVSTDVMEKLILHPWRHNARGLGSVLEALALELTQENRKISAWTHLAAQRVEVDLQFDADHSERSSSRLTPKRGRVALEAGLRSGSGKGRDPAVRRAELEAVLAANDLNVTRAAEHLEVRRTTLYRWLKECDIDVAALREKKS